jgi:hypothetical protein
MIKATASFFVTVLTGAIISLAAATGAHAQQLIDVDFNGPPSPTQSGAAVIGSAGDQWNGIDAFGADFSGTSTTSLIYANGSASGVTLVTNNSGYFYSGSLFSSTPYGNLMDDGTQVQDVGTPLTFTISGLTANGLYQFYFYSEQTHNDVPSSTTYTIDGSSQTLSSSGTQATLVEGSTYAVFNSVAADASGDILVSVTGPVTADGIAGPVNGFQMSEVPEPGTWLFGAALSCVALCSRRRNAARV